MAELSKLPLQRRRTSKKKGGVDARPLRRCLAATSSEQVIGWHYDNDTPIVRKRGSGIPAASSLIVLTFRLELLRQLDIDEPARRVVEEAGILCRAATEAIGCRRILAKDVVATQRDGGSIQHALPDRQPIIGGL